MALYIKFVILDTKFFNNSHSYSYAMVTKCIMLDKWTNKVLVEAAKEEDRSQSSVVRQAVRYYVERQRQGAGLNIAEVSSDGNA